MIAWALGKGTLSKRATVFARSRQRNPQQWHGAEKSPVAVEEPMLLCCWKVAVKVHSLAGDGVPLSAGLTASRYTGGQCIGGWPPRKGHVFQQVQAHGFSRG